MPRGARENLIPFFTSGLPIGKESLQELPGLIHRVDSLHANLPLSPCSSEVLLHLRSEVWSKWIFREIVTLPFDCHKSGHHVESVEPESTSLETRRPVLSKNCTTSLSRYDASPLHYPCQLVQLAGP